MNTTILKTLAHITAHTDRPNTATNQPTTNNLSALQLANTDTSPVINKPSTTTPKDQQEVTMPAAILDPGSPYAFWHLQADAFFRSPPTEKDGSLPDPSPLLFEDFPCTHSCHLCDDPINPRSTSTCYHGVQDMLLEAVDRPADAEYRGGGRGNGKGNGKARNSIVVLRDMYLALVQGEVERWDMERLAETSEDAKAKAEELRRLFSAMVEEVVNEPTSSQD